jgi:hypothetical protein
MLLIVSSSSLLSFFPPRLCPMLQAEASLQPKVIITVLDCVASAFIRIDAHFFLLHYLSNFSSIILSHSGFIFECVFFLFFPAFS